MKVSTLVILNSFKATGLCPFNSAIWDELLAPAVVNVKCEGRIDERVH